MLPFFVKAMLLTVTVNVESCRQTEFGFLVSIADFMARGGRKHWPCFFCVPHLIFLAVAKPAAYHLRFDDK